MGRPFFYSFLFCLLSLHLFGQDSTQVASTTETPVEKDSVPLIFTTKIYLEAIKDDTLKKYFFEQKVTNATSAAYQFPVADSANRLWQPMAEAVTHDEQPLADVIAKGRADYSNWKDYRKKREKWIKKQKKQEKKQNGKKSRKFARKFRKGKTEFNWNRLEEEEAKYEEEKKKEEEEKAERKRQKKEARKAKKEERKRKKEEKRNAKNAVPVEEEETPFWLKNDDLKEENTNEVDTDVNSGNEKEEVLEEETPKGKKGKKKKEDEGKGEEKKKKEKKKKNEDN